MNILDIEMQENDADAKTIRDYLKALLTQLWREGECFSGKRPFGNSSWEYDLYNALAASGAVRGEYDEKYKNWDHIDTYKADQLIFEAIKSL